MTLPPEPPTVDSVTVAREHAAALFAAAARHERTEAAAQLHCLAAVTLLGQSAQPVERPESVDPAGPLVTGVSPVDPEGALTEGLRVLGELDPADFAHPDVLAAAWHGRRALLEQR